MQIGEPVSFFSCETLPPQDLLFFLYIPNQFTHLLPDVLFYYHIVLQVFVSPVSTFVILVAAIKFKKLSVFYFEENMWDYKICK